MHMETADSSVILRSVVQHPDNDSVGVIVSDLRGFAAWFFSESLELASFVCLEADVGVKNQLKHLIRWTGQIFTRKCC